MSLLVLYILNSIKFKKNIGCCTWDKALLDKALPWRWITGEQLSRKGPRLLVTAGLAQASKCVFTAEGQNALGCTKHSIGSQKKWLSCYILYWCSLTLNIVCSSGLHSVKRMVRHLESTQRRTTKLITGLQGMLCGSNLMSVFSNMQHGPSTCTWCWFFSTFS